MSRVITTDLAELAKGEFQRVSLGLKPSGLMHLGTAMTFLHGMIALSNNPYASLNVTVMDLDFDYQRGRDFMSYQGKTDPNGCHEFMKEHTVEEARQTLGEMARYLGVSLDQINVSLFGDITEHPQFQKYLADLFGNESGRRLLKEIVVGGSGKSTSLLAPICGSCLHSSTVPPKYEESDGTLELRTKCFNEECDVEKYTVGLTSPRKVNIFYLVDPIRDLIQDDSGRVVDVHLFGGDYGLQYGENETPKAKRVLKLMTALTEQAPLIYVGPILTFNGTKLGKSSQNGFTVTSLRESYGNWVERLYSMLTENSEERALNMSTMGKYFR